MRGNGAADYVENQVLQLFEADATFTDVEPLARIRRMRPSLTFSISLIIAANFHTAIAQSSPTPAPTPVTLRSLLLSELHSTHDNAEWFTPIKAAVAGLTAEQAGKATGVASKHLTFDVDVVGVVQRSVTIGQSEAVGSDLNI